MMPTAAWPIVEATAKIRLLRKLHQNSRSRASFDVVGQADELSRFGARVDLLEAQARRS